MPNEKGQSIKQITTATQRPADEREDATPALYAALKEGPENALTGDYLAGLFNLSKRSIADAVEALRSDGWMICSTRNPSRPGYYIPRTVADYCEWCDQAAAEAREIANRRKAAALRWYCMDAEAAARKKARTNWARELDRRMWLDLPPFPFVYDPEAAGGYRRP